MPGQSDRAIWLAFLVSSAAHFYLIHSVAISPALIREPKQGVPFPSQVINARLVVSQSALRAPRASNTTPADFGDRKAEILNASVDRAPANKTRPALALPAIEAGAPPRPYYYQPRELSQKTSGSLDIPPELAAALAGEVPRSAVLRLQIDEKGAVDHVIIDESTFSKAEQQLLIEAFQRKKFDAGKIEDQPVKSEISLEIIVGK